MFTLSKMGWALARPSNFFLFLLILGSAWLITSRRSVGRRLTVGTTVAVAVVSLLPVGAWLLAPLENRFAANPQLPDAVDGIIALGGEIDLEVSAARDQVALHGAAERLLMLVRLARHYPRARVIFSGGSGELFGSKTSEAAVVRQALEGIGLDPERVVFEDQSRNTFENARYAKDLLEPKSGECWLLITSAYHMPRAVGVFREVGWDVLPYPVDYRTTGTQQWFGGLDVAYRLQEFDLAVHSWLGLLAYYATGRSSALLPGAPGAACSKPLTTRSVSGVDDPMMPEAEVSRGRRRAAQERSE